MYFDLHTGASRDIFSFKVFTNSPFTQILSNLLFTLNPRRLLSLVPAILCGCSGESVVETPVSFNNLSFSKVMTGWVSEDSTLDIFAFENDRLRRLDSYQRIEAFSAGNASVTSTGGDKIFFLCMNGKRGRYSWTDISSYSALKHVFVELEDEDPTKVTCTGEVSGKAGEPISDIILKPLASEIVLRSVRCDFSGTPYPNEVIKDVKVYLTNVSASCPVLLKDDFKPTRFIDYGVGNAIDKPITGETSYPDIRLLCYPNRTTEDSLGSPQTRLIIEGVIGSAIYYWPITINPEVGIERGCRYIYDILIRRKGCSDSDTPFDPISIDINMTVKPWKVKEEYTVGF
jgi:hypothetical protein